jgi:hypothetical protein
VKKTFLIVALIALLTWPWSLAGEAEQDLCLCQFVAPEYVQLARMVRVQGSVEAKVKVHADGSITEISPPVSNFMLAGQVSKILNDWRFCPGGEDRYVNITFIFKLTEPAVNGWAPTKVSFARPRWSKYRRRSSSALCSQARNSLAHLSLGAFDGSRNVYGVTVGVKDCECLGEFGAVAITATV